MPAQDTRVSSDNACTPVKQSQEAARFDSKSVPDQHAGVLGYAKLSDNALTPIKGSQKAAGFDLKSAYDYVVPARGKMLISTDLQVELPEGCYGRIAPRSGLALKNFIDVGAGVVDEDYRGNIGVLLFNHSDEDFKVNRGDRVAQLICERICYPKLEKRCKLNDTDRGDGGFGSTGAN